MSMRLYKILKMWIKRNWVSVVASSVFAALILSSTFCGFEEKPLFAAIGSVAAIYFGKVKQNVEDDKMFKELFYDFNNKYDKNFNDLINKLRYDRNTPLGDAERYLIIDYFNLCAEEYLWYSRERIPKSVWLAWKAGIIENLTVEQVKEVYLTETRSEVGRASFYGLVEELNFS